MNRKVNSAKWNFLPIYYITQWWWWKTTGFWLVVNVSPARRPRTSHRHVVSLWPLVKMAQYHQKTDLWRGEGGEGYQASGAKDVLLFLIGNGSVYTDRQKIRSLLLCPVQARFQAKKINFRYESIQVYATYPGFPSGATHSHNIIYYSPLLKVPPQERKLTDGQLCAG